MILQYQDCYLSRSLPDSGPAIQLVFCATTASHSPLCFFNGAQTRSNRQTVISLGFVLLCEMVPIRRFEEIGIRLYKPNFL
jgi:hypothetical protein